MSGMITLTSSMRSNLTSLRRISEQMGQTQQRLSTGLKVNSAIDNASSYYQARSLNNRAADLMELLNSMDTGIRTIEAATTGLESGAAFLEQATAVATEALSQALLKPLANCAQLTNNVEELLAQGYTAVSTAAELEAAVSQSDAKIVLTEDISFGKNLNFTGANVTINGGGHKLTFSSSNYLQMSGANSSVSNMEIEVKNSWSYQCLYMTGKNASVSDIKFTTIEMKNVYWHAVSLSNGGEVSNIDVTTSGSGNEVSVISVNGKATIKNVAITASMKGSDGIIAGVVARNGADVTVENIGLQTGGNGRRFGAVSMGSGKINGINGETQALKTAKEPLFDGKGNTLAMLQELGNKALAATAANEFYAPGVAADDATFGHGKWYLPAIGELMEMYGLDESKVTAGYSTSGAVKGNMNKINTTLASMGDDAATFTSGYYWSSSELSSIVSWVLNSESGYR